MLVLYKDKTTLTDHDDSKMYSSPHNTLLNFLVVSPHYNILQIV